MFLAGAAATSAFAAGPTISNTNNEVGAAREEIDAIAAARQQVEKLVEQARTDKDIVKLNCVNAKLSLINGLERVAKDAGSDLKDAAAQHDEKRIVRSAGKIHLAKQKVDQLINQAQQCVGQLANYKDKSGSVTVEAPKDLSAGGETTSPTGSGVLTSRTPPASGQ